MFKKTSDDVKKYIKFSIDLSSSFREKLIEKTTHVFTAALVFFLVWRPSQNIVFYDTKATFSFFVFLYF